VADRKRPSGCSGGGKWHSEGPGILPVLAEEGGRSAGIQQKGSGAKGAVKPGRRLAFGEPEREIEEHPGA